MLGKICCHKEKTMSSSKRQQPFFMWFWWHLSLSNLGYRNSFLVLYFFLILFVSIILVWYVEIPLPLLDGKASSFTWAGKVTNKTYSMPIAMHGLHWLLKLPNYFWPLIKTTDRKPYRFLWENNNSQFGCLCLPPWLHTWSFFHPQPIKEDLKHSNNMIIVAWLESSCVHLPGYFCLFHPPPSVPNILEWSRTNVTRRNAKQG